MGKDKGETLREYAGRREDRVWEKNFRILFISKRQCAVKPHFRSITQPYSHVTQNVAHGSLLKQRKADCAVFENSSDRKLTSALR